MHSKAPIDTLLRAIGMHSPVMRELHIYCTENISLTLSKSNFGAHSDGCSCQGSEMVIISAQFPYVVFPFVPPEEA